MSHPAADQYFRSASPFPAGTDSFPTSSKHPLSEVAEVLTRREVVRHRPALLDVAHDQKPDHKPLAESDVVLFSGVW